MAREIARSGQRCTLVVLAPEDKDRIDVALRPARRVPGHRLHTVVRTGDPRNEQALLRVAAHAARAIIVIPPASLKDDESVQWTLSTLLAMRRVAEEGFAGGSSSRRATPRPGKLLSLAGERGCAGEGQLELDIITSDEVVASILAASTRQDGLYFVLRHLLAFDGCEFYVEPVPESLAGRSFDEAHDGCGRPSWSECTRRPASCCCAPSHRASGGWSARIGSSCWHRAEASGA